MWCFRASRRSPQAAKRVSLVVRRARALNARAGLLHAAPGWWIPLASGLTRATDSSSYFQAAGCAYAQLRRPATRLPAAPRRGVGQRGLCQPHPEAVACGYPAVAGPEQRRRQRHGLAEERATACAALLRALTQVSARLRSPPYTQCSLGAVGRERWLRAPPRWERHVALRIATLAPCCAFVHHERCAAARPRP